MGQRMAILACVILCVFAGLVVYVILTRDRAPSKPAPPPPRRSASAPIRVIERRLGDGLAWSRKQYPDQYQPANRRTVTLQGRALDEREEWRCLDVAGRAYSRAVLDGFSYSDPKARQAQVTVDYLARGETFIGTIRGAGLKPNFAYQVKLRGLYDADPAGFERIGYTGRWRLPGRGTNYRDDDYRAYPHKERVEAYLLFEYFVTDGKGAVEKDFYADSTLHVLWNASMQRAPAGSDSAQIAVDRGGTDPAFYANPNARLEVQRLYAESEQHALARDNRKPIGSAFLPPGAYKAELVLTEESFHGYGDAGAWATVMTGPVEFEVTDQPRPSPTPIWSNLSGTPLALDRAELTDIEAGVQTATQMEGAAVSSDPRIAFRDAVTCEAGKRYVFVAELRARGVQTWELFLDWGTGFEVRPVHAFTTRGGDAWQRYEVEITSLVAGRTVRVRIDPAVAEGYFGVRNVGLYSPME